MFGSQDDKPSPEQSGEKKSLFGWLRKKPEAAQVAAEQVQPAPTPEAPPAEPVATAPAAPVEAPAPAAAAEVVEVPAAVEQAPTTVTEPVPVAPAIVAPTDTAQPTVAVDETPRPAFSRFRINAGTAVTHPVHEQPLPVEVLPEPQPEAEAAPVQVEQSKPGDNQGGWFARLKQSLSKTSASLGEGMASLFLGKKAIDDDLLEELETRLLTADVGVEATGVIIDSLTKRVARKELADSGALYKALQEELGALLKPVEQPLLIAAEKQPYVILVVGVNGVGKTTTIGKLAKKLQGEGKKVMLAAGDTFRAAAVEQLQVWGERNNIAVIAQHTGADSASVIFDAVQAAKARGIDVLIADTAGRLHTKDNLMEELKKVRRVIGKLDETAPHEVLLVLDAGTGQNAINQTKQFNQAVALTGLALTKLDGTAKGGVIFALAKQFGLPIRYIGVGEGIDDLRTFVAEDFVQALFAEREQG
ncbi:signal recognition particle-docking protein FtsY [Pseudomonas alcaligenes]|uniref:signal recognition particle-docking protein FtsY n=1 Tax=Aquipseudomonas alcaligenes TaxID=43263 RepID=UPI002E7B56E6|nr:signal recognition particle-docking protein FtsY [Pseudomonas alcaligenes]MEE1949155.1 signal recognition particle-docking protein FtsY [Pseudomonas alcaligenes]